MSIYQTIINLLEDNNISYQTRTHEPTLTSKDSAKARGEELSTGAKAIVMKVQNDFCLLVLPANQKVDSNKVKQYFKDQGKRVRKIRFASSEELLEQTGLVSGSVPPFGHPILAYPLFVDPTLLKNESISFNAGSLTKSLTISTVDYEKVADVTFFDFGIVSS